MADKGQDKSHGEKERGEKKYELEKMAENAIETQWRRRGEDVALKKI